MSLLQAVASSQSQSSQEGGLFPLRQGDKFLHDAYDDNDYGILYSKKKKPKKTTTTTNPLCGCESITARLDALEASVDALEVSVDALEVSVEVTSHQSPGKRVGM